MNEDVLSIFIFLILTFLFIWIKQDHRIQVLKAHVKELEHDLFKATKTR